MRRLERALIRIVGTATRENETSFRRFFRSDPCSVWIVWSVKPLRALPTPPGGACPRGEILALDAHVEVPFGSFDGALETEDTTPLEPKVIEHKFYAKGVGPVLTIDVGGGGREELVSFSR